METHVDYANVSQYVAQMRTAAETISNLQKTLSYYYYGSIRAEGQYAQAFGQMKCKVDHILSEMAIFMNSYATIADAISQDLGTLDADLAEVVSSVGRG